VEEHLALEAERGAGVAHRGPLRSHRGHALERARDGAGFRFRFDARIYTSEEESP
jgi:hypothetical protein